MKTSKLTHAQIIALLRRVALDQYRNG